jgi:glycosyltransferase involved in cell wall biosynthesis
MTVLIWILWDLYRKPQALRAGLEAYVLGAYVSIGGSILDFLQGRHITRYVEGRAVFDSRKFTFFRNADIFIYPSHHECMPIAVIEAMASAIAIVANRVGGLPDLIIDGENGILVDSGRPDQMASAILGLAADEETCYSMQRKSHQFAVERFHMEEHADQLVSVYRSIALRYQGAI